MSAIKVVLIVLALIVILFVVLVIIAPGGSTTTSASTFSSDDHTTLASMNSVLGRFAPKLPASALSPQLHSFDLTRLPRYEATILPDKSQKFRLLRFSASPSKYCASVVYTPADPNDFDKNTPQTSEGSGSRKQPQTFSFTAFSGGGKLTINRAFPLDRTPCTVMLEVAQ